MRYILLFCACTVIFLAYRYGNSPLPGEVPLSMKFMMSTMSFMGDLMKIASFCGLGDKLIMQKKLYASLPIDIPVPDGVQTEDLMFDGVMVRLFRPKGLDNNVPAVVYIHGGGWIFGSVDFTNEFCGNLAKDLGIIAVSVEYRLAPEYPFPIPFQDCETATVHLLKYGQKYGVDPTRIAVAGDSAGGNIAAAVALKLRNSQQDHPPLKAQALLYPALQAVDFFTPSYQKHQPGENMLSRADIISMWSFYAQGHSQNVNVALENNHVIGPQRKIFAKTSLDHKSLNKKFIHESYVEPSIGEGNAQVWEEMRGILLNQYFAPLMASNLKGLPPAFVLACEFDFLRDDALFYSEKLKQDEVVVELYYSAKGIHGIITMPYENEETQKIRSALFTFLRKFL